MSSRIQSLQQGDPRRIGPYRVVGRLGSGGMGTIHAALSAAGERLAVKVVHPAQADDEFRARFRRGVQLSRRDTGLCPVPVLDADASAPWHAGASIPGPTLGQYVAASGPLAEARLHAVATSTAAALPAVHEAGVSKNVILTPSGRMELNFGIAHAMNGTSVTRTGVMTGTPGWISPEHHRTATVVSTPGPGT
ncbi:hypothetical protein [Streptomyces sp. NPDC020597]|uniref:hypothetical protein n=1 Tax=unclassified Streptomyces TaxID=2593676 RepID=UPI00379AE9DF